MQNKVLKIFYKQLLKTPFLNRYSQLWYKKLGVKGKAFRISNDIKIVGDYSFLALGNQTEINTGCFLLSKDKIVIGDNSTLAYQATILTSSNPNGPHNLLSKVYPKITAPVKIGHNCWIGSRAVILPGVTIGNFCVIAAGSIVTKDVADYHVVGGIPAKTLKILNSKLFE